MNGQMKVHINVDLDPAVPLEKITAVFPKSDRVPHPGTSIKNYPQNENSKLGMLDANKEASSTVTSVKPELDLGKIPRLT